MSFYRSTKVFVSAPIRDFHITAMGQVVGAATSSGKAIISLGFEDGSIGTIQYFANGGNAFPKERVEACAGDAILQLDNASTLRGFGWWALKTPSLWRQDKGQYGCAAAFLGAVRNGLPAPIPAVVFFGVARVSIRLTPLQRDG